ncbi:hypothetical protein C2E23DRAFT_884704 [Lenzites betulinus]|nr:hypothetical protein C2E23DRAFT_884704 [Lenzites betulinus]
MSHAHAQTMHGTGPDEQAQESYVPVNSGRQEILAGDREGRGPKEYPDGAGSERTGTAGGELGIRLGTVDALDGTQHDTGDGIAGSSGPPVPDKGKRTSNGRWQVEVLPFSPVLSPFSSPYHNLGFIGEEPYPPSQNADTTFVFGKADVPPTERDAREAKDRDSRDARALGGHSRKRARIQSPSPPLPPLPPSPTPTTSRGSGRVGNRASTEHPSLFVSAQTLLGNKQSMRKLRDFRVSKLPPPVQYPQTKTKSATTRFSLPSPPPYIQAMLVDPRTLRGGQMYLDSASTARIEPMASGSGLGRGPSEEGELHAAPDGLRSSYSVNIVERFQEAGYIPDNGVYEGGPPRSPGTPCTPRRKLSIGNEHRAWPNERAPTPYPRPGIQDRIRALPPVRRDAPAPPMLSTLATESGMREERTVFVGKMATLQPYEPQGFVFTPAPEGGFGTHDFRDQFYLIRDIHPDKVRQIIDEPNGTTILVEPWGACEQSATALRLMTARITAAIASETKETAFRVVQPEPDRTGRPKTHAGTWAVIRLSSPAAERMAEQRMWSDKTITFCVHRWDFRTPKLVVRLKDLDLEHDEDLVQMVWETFNGPYVLPHIRSLIDAGHVYPVDAPPEELANYILGSLNVQVTKMGGKAVEAAVYCEPPSIKIPEWTQWREAVASAPFSTLLSRATAVIPTPCQGCHNAAHSAEYCPYPLLPGWNGPKSAVVARPQKIVPHYSGAVTQGDPASYRSFSDAARGFARGAPGPGRGRGRQSDYYGMTPENFYGYTQG